MRRPFLFPEHRFDAVFQRQPIHADLRIVVIERLLQNLLALLRIRSANTLLLAKTFHISKRFGTL